MGGSRSGGQVSGGEAPCRGNGGVPRISSLFSALLKRGYRKQLSILFASYCKNTGDERKRGNPVRGTGNRGPPLPGCKGDPAWEAGNPLVFPSFPKRWGGYALRSQTAALVKKYQGHD